jgi:GNAT superfamily N-acetyltransferase
MSGECTATSAPEHRARGVGHLLLEAVLTWARAGAQGVALDVTRSDNPAVRLYARAGFRPAGDPKPLRAGSALTVQPVWLALADAHPPSA